MKKLMIAAAAAAMIGGAFADGVAQVYDFTATVKTSACSGKSAKDVCGDTVYYRSQISQKLYGKFWGCGCKVIACPDNYGMPYEDDQGYMFWLSTKQDGAFHGADMSWSILQRLGKKGENVEGAFDLTLTDCDGETVAVLKGAGYGTAKIYCEDGLSTEESYIKSMAGNIVGTWDASSDVIATGCAYCGAVDECTVFAFCECVAENNDQAAVYGTFTIKYNAGQTKSVNSGKYIDEVAFKNNKAVLAEFDCIAADDDDDDDDEKTAKEIAQEQYTAAVKAQAEAQTAYDNAKAAADKIDETIAAKVKALADDVTAANKANTDAVNELVAAAAADQNVQALSTADSEVKTINAKIATAKENLAKAKTAADVKKYNAEIESLNKDLADAETAAKTCRAACTDAAKLAAYDAAYAKAVAAEEALDDANEAKAAYDSKAQAAEKDAAAKAETEAADALEEAKDNVKFAKVACTAAGTVCE